MSTVCSKSFVDWGFTPDPTVGAYSTPPDLLAVFRGLLLKGGEWRERTGERGQEERGEEVREGVRPLP